ncbi:pyridoxal 5'-phosphate synthase glutaminase subunit PdxT [Fictibacillus phosphorivorans]|uniref:pyridoxal 5'-phosphate synthase glutaminase subunit PdxT n=1 Tax=Fictibacillus phosphorivorans TaxID=1221500 RepID=UPI00203AC98B|nr:pyridoxal 5'-phosphate synthase glutaminase subunit PdxT [Fictibacillus phosphorivorans]MCM3720274.1 pyridoxal 5'-phosphate synthase glutaminase subunit PdxT [Fictibacillus phosphorivorans]MCM3777964.1 pyridoxal 5'-phosphate synthase glutaminase subunit PdxT [Fictibacillus phosphorivorans]
MLKIGILALQGAVQEHAKAIEASGAQAVAVKRVEELHDLDGLVIPGGESTAMRRLIDKYQFLEPLKEFAKNKPVFGTCAGMILMAKRIQGQDSAHLELIDMTVERNAFGRQVDSFEADLMIHGVGEDFTGVFIRAPYIVEVGPDVEILSKHNDRIVAAKHGHFLCAAFHPELTDDYRLHQYFVKMVQTSKEVVA